jgi:tRNA nucleotidyltransferase (CCA-adding enzyme)
MIGKYWEHFKHNTGFGVRGIGASIEEAFEKTAMALTTAITNPKEVVPLDQVEIACHAPNYELLLIEWLNALLHEMTTKCMLFSHFDVRINGNRLQATAWGEVQFRDRDNPFVEVKGATPKELLVREDETGTWLAQCVVEA